MIFKYIVEDEFLGKQVKQVLKHKMKISERLIKMMKYDGKILINGLPVRVNELLKLGDLVEANVTFDEETSDITPQDIPIEIIYEDEYLVAVNKRSNIVVHPTFSHPDGTIANGLMFYMQKQGIMRKIRPVSRLDRDTTGIIIFAKNQFVQQALIEQMNQKLFEKEYFGVVFDDISPSLGTIDLPIARKPDSIMLREISPIGDHAVTHYQTIELFNQASLVKFKLDTGRTHQIRVHCQAINHPLLGDGLYPYLLEDENTSRYHSLSLCISRQALHSFRAAFFHPYTHEKLELCANLPEDMINLLEILRK